MAPSLPSVESRESGCTPPRPRQSAARARIPRYARAVLEALRFHDCDTGLLRDLSDADYRKLLGFCDKARLALLLDRFHGDALPAWVRERLQGNLRDYSQRFARLKESLFETADAFERAGIEFAVLKGMTHAPEFTPDPLLRAQGDIDLWVPPESVSDAREVLLALGYLPQGRSEGRHLPPMLRPGKWQWDGNYYAPDLPVSIELHHRLWDEEMEFIAVPGEAGFWDRRVRKPVAGRLLPALSMPDTLGFAALHLLMHTLHGDLRLAHAWEIARFLETHAADGVFWDSWLQLHPAGLRRLESIVFRLVAEWFACDLPSCVTASPSPADADVDLWIERYAWSPVEAIFRPKKDEIWLQLCLVESFRARLAVLRRRVLPLRLLPSPPVGAPRTAHAAAAHAKFALRFAAVRCAHHSRALLPVLAGGARWQWRRARFGSGLARYLAASALFNSGVLIYLVLYNLYLLELGYHEDLLGRVAGAMRIGSLLATLPAAAIARRHGLRAALLAATLGTAATALLRTWNGGPRWLTAGAFASGIFLAMWTVSFSPSIAELTSQRNRRLGFSVSCAVGMAVGIPAGWIAGQMAGWMGEWLHASRAESLLWALVAASGIAMLGALPVAGLRFRRLGAAETKTYPRPRAVAGFLAAISLWTLATGAFNPFFNAFFAERVRMSVRNIGSVFSYSHAAQALALLAASSLLKKVGDARGIAYCQLAAGAALALLAGISSPAGAASVYIAYMSFQYMSEPGLFSVLMDRVAPGERGGAAAMYFVVVSLAGSLAAFAAGPAISRFGYGPLLAVCGAAAMAAAFLFRALVPERP